MTVPMSARQGVFSDGREWNDRFDVNYFSGCSSNGNEEKDNELADWLSELNTDGLFFFQDQKKHNIVQKPQYKPSSLKPGITSLEVFTSFVKDYTNCNNGERIVDCSGILSSDCYKRWLETRQVYPSHPEECFRKSIISHITCSDGGSSPFPKHIEKGLLEIARKRQIWPCFENMIDSVSGKPIKIGIKGLRSLGFHEKRELESRGADLKQAKRRLSNQNKFPIPHVHSAKRICTI